MMTHGALIKACLGPRFQRQMLGAVVGNDGDEHVAAADIKRDFGADRAVLTAVTWPKN